MARTVSFSEYPYLIWRIRSLPTILQMHTNYFYYEGSRLYLTLKQENSIDVDNDCFAMYLDEWGSWVDGLNSFLVTVCLRDKHGQSCWIQTTEVTAAVLDSAVSVWHAKRSDLISKYDDLSTDNTVTFICTIGPCEMDGLRGQWSIEKAHKSVQASLTIGERNLNALSEDLLNLLQDCQKTDVVLRCADGSRLSAHKAILSARSEVFAAMFRNSMSEDESGVVNIVDIEPVVLLHFLKYLYSGSVDGLSIETSSLLYVAGDKYAVRGLKECCVDFMVRNISEEKVFDYVVLADTHSDANFRDAVVDYIAKNDGLLREKVWLEFWRKEPNLAFELYEAYVKKCSSQTD